MPPKKLKYQNVSGMMLARAFSVAILARESDREQELREETDEQPDDFSARRDKPPMDKTCPMHLASPYDLAAVGLALAPDASSAIGGSCVRLRSQLTPTRSYSPIRARPRLVYFDAPLSLGRSLTAS